MADLLAPGHPTVCPVNDPGACEPVEYEAGKEACFTSIPMGIQGDSSQIVGTIPVMYLCKHCRKPYAYQITEP